MNSNFPFWSIFDSRNHHCILSYQLLNPNIFGVEISFSHPFSMAISSAPWLRWESLAEKAATMATTAQAEYGQAKDEASNAELVPWRILAGLVESSLDRDGDDSCV